MYVSQNIILYTLSSAITYAVLYVNYISQQN